VPNFGSCEKRTAAQYQMPIFFCERNTFFYGSRHCAVVFFSQVQKLYTELDLSLLYILTWGTCSKFTRKDNFLALGVCFPQPSSSAGRKFAASRSRIPTNPDDRRIVSFPQQNKKNVLKCVVNWIPLTIRVRWRNTQPHQEGRLGFVETHVRI